MKKWFILLATNLSLLSWHLKPGILTEFGTVLVEKLREYLRQIFNDGADGYRLGLTGWPKGKNDKFLALIKGKLNPLFRAYLHILFQETAKFNKYIKPTIMISCLYSRRTGHPIKLTRPSMPRIKEMIRAAFEESEIWSDKIDFLWEVMNEPTPEEMPLVWELSIWMRDVLKIPRKKMTLGCQTDVIRNNGINFKKGDSFDALWKEKYYIATGTDFSIRPSKGELKKMKQQMFWTQHQVSKVGYYKVLSIERGPNTDGKIVKYPNIKTSNQYRRNAGDDGSKWHKGDDRRRLTRAQSNASYKYLFKDDYVWRMEGQGAAIESFGFEDNKHCHNSQQTRWIAEQAESYNIRKLNLNKWPKFVGTITPEPIEPPNVISPDITELCKKCLWMDYDREDRMICVNENWKPYTGAKCPHFKNIYDEKKEVKKMTFKSIREFIWKWIKKFFVDFFKQYRALYFVAGGILIPPLWNFFRWIFGLIF